MANRHSSSSRLSVPEIKVSLKKLPRSRVALTIRVFQQMLGATAKRVYSAIAPQVTVAGFRPGKAPIDKTIEAFGRVRFSNEVLNLALKESYQQGLEKNQLVPVAGPSISLAAWRLDERGRPLENLVYTAEVDVMPKVSVSGYQSIRLKDYQPLSSEVTDQEVEAVLDHLSRQRGELKPLDRPARLGDWILISFKGSIEGVVKEPLTSKNYPLVLGSRRMVHGFEDNVVGMKAGQKKTFELRLPKSIKDLGGRRAGFEVLLHEVKEIIKRPIDQAFAQSLGHESLESLKKAIRANLVREKSQRARQHLEQTAIRELLKKLSVEIPDSLIERELGRMLDSIRESVTKQGLTMEGYLASIKKTIEQLAQDLRTRAQDSVRAGLALTALGQAEAIDTNQPGSTNKVINRLIEIGLRSDKKSDKN